MFFLFDRSSAEFKRKRRAWEETRQRGEARFVFLSAAVFGGFVFILHTLRDVFFREKPPNLPLLAESALISFALGVLYGLIGWCINEWLYRRAKAARS